MTDATKITIANTLLAPYDDVLTVKMVFEDGKVHKLSVWKLIEKFLMIRTDDGLIPFYLNEDQCKLYIEICKDILAGKPIREDILKARQLGFSTLIAGIIFVLTAFQTDKNAFVVADKSDNTNAIFNIYQTYYDALPDYIKQMIPKKNKNAYELSFDYGKGHTSSIKVVTQGDDAGRASHVQYIHLSECSRYDDLKSTLTSILQAVSSTSLNSMVFLETTAHGYNYYKEIWDKHMAGKGGFKALFYAWFTKKEYSAKYDGHELLPFESELRKKIPSLTLDQIQWYRNKYEELNEDLDELRQEHPSTPMEAFISSGSSVFNKQLISQREEELFGKSPLHRGFFSFTKKVSEDGGHIELSNIKFIETPFGDVSIYEEPIAGHPYLINNDPAMGGSDYWATQVFDNHNLHQCAVFHKSGCDADEAAFQTVCLASYYADPKGKTVSLSKSVLLSGETNTTSYLLETASKCGIKNIYQDQDVEDLSGRYINRFGYKTKQNNRQYMIDLAIIAFRENPKIINDLETLSEMETFQYIESGVKGYEKPQAEAGKHDDLVMAMCGFFLCRTSLTSVVSEKPSKTKEFYDKYGLLDDPKDTVKAGYNLW